MNSDIHRLSSQEIKKSVETQPLMLKIAPQSQKFILKTMINVVLLSFMMGYTMVYFNAINFEDLIVIFNLKLEKSFAQGFFTACIPASACAGALLSKVLLSKLTRKQCFDAMNAMCIGGVLLIQSKYVPLIIVGRLLQGALIGVGTALVPLYIKEFIPQMNGKYGLYNQLFFTFGLVCAFVFNLVLHSIFKDSSLYWRWLFGFPLVISLYQLYMLHFHYNYETPKYLVSINMNQEAKDLLKRIYKPQFVEKEFHILYQAVHQKSFENHVQDTTDEIEEIRTVKLNKDVQLCQLQNGKQKDFKASQLKNPLIKKHHKPLNNPLAVFCAFHLSFQQQIIGIGAVIVYSADIIKQIVPSLFYSYAIIVNTFGLCCVIFGLFLIEKYGRVILLQVGAIIITLCLFIIGTNFLLGEDRVDWMILTTVIILRGTFSCTLGPLTWLYMAEIVKPNIIPYGTFINWLFATLSMFLFPILSQLFGGPGWIFIINGSLCLLTVIINAITLVETKNKNQLMIRKDFDEQLQALKRHKLFHIFSSD